MRARGTAVYIRALAASEARSPPVASLTQRTVRNIGLVAALQFTAAAINTLALVIDRKSVV